MHERARDPSLPLHFHQGRILVEHLPAKFFLSGQPENAREVGLEVRAQRAATGSGHSSFVVSDYLGA